MAVLTHGEVLARFGHALSDPTRSRLLLALREAPGYPADLAETLGVGMTRAWQTVGRLERGRVRREGG